MAKNKIARDILGGIFGGLIVIWVGVSFYLVMVQMITWSQWGAYFCLGLAALFLLNGIAWLFVPGLRGGFIGMLIPALFLGVVGIVPILGGGWEAWTTWWPLIIVAVGLVIIVSTIWGIASKRRKDNEEIQSK